MRSRLPFAIVIALALSACTRGSTPTTTIAPSSTTTSSTTSSEPTATTLPVGTEDLPPGIREEIARLIPATEEVRGLRFLEPPKIIVITTDELSARVIEKVSEDFENVDADEAMYKLLGLVDEGFDLGKSVTELYGENVAGYYDSDAKELVVTAREDAFSPLEEVTLVHELTHALTDQHHDYSKLYDSLYETDSFDQFTAFQGLIEGDATLTELLFAQQLSPDEIQELLEEAFAVDTGVDEFPLFMQQSLAFPYDAGAGFVQSLYEAGGFATVDQAYDDPPRSTEQVITPGDYGRDEPQVVPLNANELAGYDIIYNSTWGELGFRLMFDQVLGGAEEASSGWGGDSYRQYFNGTDALLVILYQGDTPADLDDMSAAMIDYIEVAMDLTEGTSDGKGQVFTGERFVFLSSSGNQFLFIAAGDPTAGATARAWFPEF